MCSKHGSIISKHVVWRNTTAKTLVVFEEHYLVLIDILHLLTVQM